MSYVGDSNYNGSSPLKNWVNAKIVMDVILNDGTTKYTCLDYIRLSVNRNATYNVYHSVGKHNQGYIKLPKGYTFTFTVPVTSPDVQIFRSIFHSEALFSLTYEDVAANLTDPDSVEFKLVRERLNNCILTSMNDTYEVEGVPMVVFNGTALSNNFVAKIDKSAINDTLNFGDNSQELQYSDVYSDKMVDPNYWDVTPSQ